VVILSKTNDDVSVSEKHSWTENSVTMNNRNFFILSYLI